MESFNKKPTIKEVFDALTDEESSPDWDTSILTKADQKDIRKVNEVLSRAWPLSESANYLNIRR